MRKITATVLCLVVFGWASAQKLEKTITAKRVKKVEKILSADAMQGRGLFSEGLNKAADFIAGQFNKAGLETSHGLSSYFQEFSLVDARQMKLNALCDGHSLTEKEVFVFSTQPSLTLTDQSGYETAAIVAGDRLYQKVYGYINAGKNLVVWVDTSHAKMFPNLARFKQERFAMPYSVVFVLANKPASFRFEVENEIIEKKLKNVVGVLPGKGRKEEIVIFSGHYDHLGIGKPNDAGDSIYNGANDDAAGITAVVLLAKYFGKMADNERTIVFAAFTAEESGGFGSQYFSKQFDPAKVVAMFNIEMIGTDSKWGKNSAYITGYDKTDMGSILEKNLQGTRFKFYPDPYPDQQLFYRSDNATLAMLGVPAHTISTSKMDNEPYYHTADDEIETLDMKNMAEIIKAIALSSRTIVNGTDTPSRVDTSRLR